MDPRGLALAWRFAPAPAYFQTAQTREPPMNWPLWFAAMLAAIAAPILIPLIAAVVEAVLQVWPYLLVAFLFFRFCT